MSRQPADLSGLQQAFPYPRSGGGATTDLGRLILEEIENEGPIPFSDYMGRCLYHPSYGYYARPGATTVSRDGDFMTSVSVGPVFGMLLARRLHSFWTANRSPSLFTVIEIGPHDGSLALDILNAIKVLDPKFDEAVQYFVVEPLSSRRPLLAQRLGQRAEVVESPEELEFSFGAVLANEVLDALPVPLYLRSRDQWHEVFVGSRNGQLDWDTRSAAISFPDSLPEGYVSEGSPDFESLLKPYAEAMERGLFIWIDYGLEEIDLLHPARTAGTLRCFRKHRSDAHPLDDPGEQDITADVNFTAFEETARSLGLDPHAPLNQSRYLTYLARSWILENPDPTEIKQFQTLIHPSQFGNRFHAHELTKGDVNRAFP